MLGGHSSPRPGPPGLWDRGVDVNPRVLLHGTFVLLAGWSAPATQEQGHPTPPSIAWRFGAEALLCHREELAGS